jgi:glyoxylase-like metal-dependent hydrolase (beta-lactamase superfamily II)
VATVTQLDKGLHCIDLEFQGQPGVIAAYLVEDAGERALVETGPTSTLDTLLAALHGLDIEPDTISKLLVTHVHLDHAGASGTFLRRFPQAQLFVHEIGAPHMIDPSKLLASATRIYGDLMGPLWGEVEPVPEDKITVLTDEDAITVGNRRLTALYTPGHASHHVAYHDVDHDLVFTGDVAAARLQGVRYVRPPTPPPDIDLGLWSESLERIRRLHPRTLLLTHFGPSTEVDWHLQEAHDRLYAWAELVNRARRSGQDQPEIVDTLRLQGDDELLRLTNDASVLERYELAAPYGMSVDGYLRYLKKRAQTEAHTSS